jgi:hypothetical protein
LLLFILAISGSIFSKVVPQQLDLLFEDIKTVNNGEPQLEIFKISKIAKFGCFGYWLNSFPLKEEFTALTLDKEYLFRFTLPYP